jgi:hypothetical protein
MNLMHHLCHEEMMDLRFNIKLLSTWLTPRQEINMAPHKLSCQKYRSPTIQDSQVETVFYRILGIETLNCPQSIMLRIM